MKIVVCVNRVPDTETKVKVGADGKSIDPAGVNSILNPYDEYAIEAALKMKEAHGGETTAVTLGPETHKDELRKALAMGIEKAILLKDATPRDSFSVARALADAIKTLSPDCVIFGKQSIDYYNEQVPGLVAGLLGFSSVSVVVKLEIKDGVAHCVREIEGGQEVVEAKLPVVLTAQKGLFEPRYPSLKGIMASKTKPIEERLPAPYPAVVDTVVMSKPAPKPSGKIVGTDATAVPELVRLLHEEAKII